MVVRYESGSGTAAGLWGHPLHPMIVPLPIGAFVGAFVADAFFIASGDSFWATAAFWLLGGGLIAGAVAALLGIIEMMGVRRARTMGLAWLHGALNVVVLGIAAASYVMRRDAVESAIGGAGIYMTGAIVVLLIITGWVGGEMTYRHGVGVDTNIGLPGETPDHDRTPSGRPDEGQA